MIYDAADFIFDPPIEVSRARRVLIKPAAPYSLPYPVTTSRETLAAVIRGIRRISDADIILLECPIEEHARSVYRSLGYDFPRILGLDVRDCTLVEVENPLPKPFAMPNFWIPNVLLSCDYLISVAPFRVREGHGWLSTANLLGLLPRTKYTGETGRERTALSRFDIQGVIADLYFTVPFDLGIIDARMKFLCDKDMTNGAIEEHGKIFVGEPSEVDEEVSCVADIPTRYVQMITVGKADMEAPFQE